MVDVYKYRIECVTDSKDEHVWRDETQPVPTLCPTNSDHTVGLIVKVDQLLHSSITIKEESVPTGGYFQATSICLHNINAGPSVVTSKTVSYDIPVSGLAFSFITESNQKGDVINVIIGKDTTVGILLDDVKVGDVTFNVQQSVIDNVFIGMYIKLSDGLNDDDCGLIVSINDINKTITVNTATTHSFSLLTPTYVKGSIYTVKDYHIGPAFCYDVGSSKIGGSYLPTGATITVEYTNNTNDSDKTLYIETERLY
jgi:hypothetical protein